jgi:homopolymeric O-antigen transport system ATP-binding protein
MAPAVELHGIVVRYRLPRERIPSVKTFVIRWLERRIEFQNFEALNNVSLAVSPGQVLGIVGRNGSGKSTLLRVIARILKPTWGQVYVTGRIAPLLDIGAGFDSELTGRENIYLNGALFGLGKKEIGLRVPSIVEFAELSEFIDAPLRTFSSGMLARLGFAVATSVDADILLVDEVLGVGDERFQAKCHARIEEYRRRGTTIILVSHNTEMIANLCDSAVWLDHGRVQMSGDARQVASAYKQFLRTDEAEGARFFHPRWFVPRVEFIRMVVDALQLTLIAPEKATFSDVPRAAPLYAYVETAYANGLIEGYEGGSYFLPSFTVQRGEAVNIARKASARAAVRSPTPFTLNLMPAPEMLAAQGWNNPWDGIENNDGLGRAAAAALIVEGCHLECIQPARPSFIDVPADAPYYRQIETALKYGVLDQWLQ